MSFPVTADGRLHAPYFLYLRCGGRFTDEQLLQQFGLNDYVPAAVTRHLGRHALVTNFEEWTLLTDDWYYTLWHRKTTRPVLSRLGQAFDVFACSVGDCDRSFDFVYYRDGRLSRNYVVRSPHFNDRIVAEDVGEPLPAEAAAIEAADETDIVLHVAASLGLKTRFRETDFRAYVPRTDPDS